MLWSVNLKLIFYSQLNVEYKILKVSHFTNSLKIWTHLAFNDSKHTSKKFGGVHVFHMAASPIILTTSVNIWNWDQLLHLWERNVVPFLSDRGQSAVCSAVQHFIWCAKCFQLVKGLDRRKAVQKHSAAIITLCCWNRGSMCFNIVLLHAWPNLKKSCQLIFFFFNEQSMRWVCQFA